MTTHTFHGDVHLHGLYDGCPRCAELANQPTTLLDQVMLERLVKRVNRDLPARSDNEALAMTRIGWKDPR